MKKDLLKMLEALINDDGATAKDAFHAHMVSKSRKVLMKEADRDDDLDTDDMEDNDLEDMDVDHDDLEGMDHDEDDLEGEDHDDLEGEDHDENEIPEVTVRWDATKGCYVVRVGDEEAELGAKNKEEAEMEAVKLVNDKILSEKWKKPYKTPEEKKGMFKGRNLASLRKELAELKKSGPHKRGSAEHTKMSELEFAIRAKQKGESHWGKVKK